MNSNTSGKLAARDFITIGIFAAINLVIFFVIGGIAGMTLIGTVANIPITVFFTAIAYMLLVSKVRKRGTFLIMGIVSALPGLMAANIIGVIASIAGWVIAEIFAGCNHYKNKKILILAYVTGCTLHSIGYTLPMYASNAQYLIDRQEILHLTDDALQTYLQMFTWPVFFSMVALTVVTSFLGALISIKLLKKHFEKAGLV
ncbi:MAG: MptD family putative ECF transporter S component [Treponema sp.]|nr:MptD family putative ECF transporter S component [Treponema sp.]